MPVPAEWPLCNGFAHRVRQKVVAARQCVLFVLRQIIIPAHFCGTHGCKSLRGRCFIALQAPHRSRCSLPVLSPSGIPGKKCGTIVFTAEELSNCRVSVTSQPHTHTHTGVRKFSTNVRIHDSHVQNVSIFFLTEPSEYV